MVMHCIRCKAQLPNGASFCVECRSPVRDMGISAGVVMAPPARATSHSERRLLTVLFCDLVGSTALSARLDPEDLRDVLAAYQRRATEIVEQAGGLVARYEGDGILAYFGYPVSNEDDAERAVSAGLELAQAINEGSGVSEKLGVRVGIASGIVIIGDLSLSNAADRPPIVGETPNLAARLQSLAEPNTVVIAPSTQRLVGGLFEYRNPRTHDLKGFSQPVQAWQVIGPNVAASRFEALRSKLPLIGREKEIGLLLQRWAQAKSGAGQAVLIVGEPGIGKSRLKLELLSRISQEFPVLRRYYCSPRHKDSMLHPLLAQLQKAAMFDRADSPDEKLNKLEALAAGGAVSSEVLGLLADLMAVPRGKHTKTLRLDARRRRRILFEALGQGLERIAQQKPTIITVEDIHWIDPTSRHLLETIVRRLVHLPVLLVLTSRPDEMPAWLGQPHVSLIEMGPVGDRSAELLVRQIPGADELPIEALRNIVARADGVPLFIEELTKATVEGTRSATSLQAIPTVPVSLHASLMARLDRLVPARDIARLAAGVGREFPFELLRLLAVDHSEAELQAFLRQLISAELILPVSSYPSATFAFRHALIQDVAYSTLLRQERRELHGRIAEALQVHFPETVAMQPEGLAWHLTRAELLEPAIRYWSDAGDRAAARAAFAEAVDHFTEGIRICQLLPASRERDKSELKLRLSLGPLVMATRGYAAPEGLQVYSRANELVSHIGTARERMEVLLGLYNVHYGRAELDLAMAVAKQNLAVAEGEGILKGRAYTLMGQTYAAIGDFLQAKVAFERAIGIFELEPESPQSFGVFGSQHVISLAFIAGVHFALGEPELAHAATAQSILRARQLRHPMSLALALVTELLTPVPGGLKVDPAQAEEAIRFCSQQGLSNFEIWARFALGAIVARRGNPRDGIKTMRAAIDSAEKMSSRLLRPMQYAAVASAHARVGELDEAYRLLDEALRFAETTGERRADASLHRLYGELLVAAGRHDDGRRALMRALEVARLQGARGEELRVAKSIGVVRGNTMRSTTRARLLAWLRMLGRSNKS